MNRLLMTIASFVSVLASASAEPIPWMYSATIRPANWADGIILGQETLWQLDPVNGGEQGIPYFVLSNLTKTGSSQSGTETPTITPQTPNNSVSLFSFGHGDWTTTETLPTGQAFAMNKFMLEYAFADGDSQGETYRGAVEGNIWTSGVFRSGTGNFNIGLDHTDTIQLGNRKVKVRFWGSNNESHSTIFMDVTEVVETPEPATLALAGIGLAGLAGFKLRRKARVRAGKR